MTTDDELARVLEREFGSYLAHNPHNADRFWGQAAQAVRAHLLSDAVVERAAKGAATVIDARTSHVEGTYWSGPDYRRVLLRAEARAALTAALGGGEVNDD